MLWRRPKAPPGERPAWGSKPGEVCDAEGSIKLAVLSSFYGDRIGAGVVWIPLEELPRAEAYGWSAGLPRLGTQDADGRQLVQVSR